MSQQQLPRRGADMSIVINDSTPPAGDSGKTSELFSWIANQLKSVLGETSWRTATSITLKALSNHKARHAPEGDDALETAAPAGGLGIENGIGSSNSLARSDHQHAAFDATAPTGLGATALAGTSNYAARRDHVHTLPSLAALSATQRSASTEAFSVLPGDILSVVPTTLNNTDKRVRFRLGTVNENSATPYADVIDFSTGANNTFGGVNALYLRKDQQRLVHKYAVWGSTTWTTKNIAYSDEVYLKTETYNKTEIDILIDAATRYQA